MATSSTIPTVRAALVAQLAARPGLAAVQVDYAHPGQGLGASAIFLGDSRGTSGIPTIRAARKARQEAYVIDVWVEVNDDGPTGQGASEAAWTVVAEIDGMLADDPSLGLGQPFWAVLAETEQSVYFDDTTRGYVSRIRVGVSCEARLQ